MRKVYLNPSCAHRMPIEKPRNPAQTDFSACPYNAWHQSSTHRWSGFSERIQKTKLGLFWPYEPYILQQAAALHAYDVSARMLYSVYRPESEPVRSSSSGLVLISFSLPAACNPALPAAPQNTQSTTCAVDFVRFNRRSRKKIRFSEFTRTAYAYRPSNTVRRNRHRARVNLVLGSEARESGQHVHPLLNGVLTSFRSTASGTIHPQLEAIAQDPE